MSPSFPISNIRFVATEKDQALVIWIATDWSEFAPEILQELSLSQPSFSRISLETAHAMIDRYFVGGKIFGGLLSERNVTIIWNTLTLPAPALPNLMLVPVNLSLPHHYRIQ